MPGGIHFSLERGKSRKKVVAVIKNKVRKSQVKAGCKKNAVQGGKSKDSK